MRQPRIGLSARLMCRGDGNAEPAWQQSHAKSECDRNMATPVVFKKERSLMKA
jgi:hypothetical protein